MVRPYTSALAAAHVARKYVPVNAHHHRCHRKPYPDLAGLHARHDVDPDGGSKLSMHVRHPARPALPVGRVTVEKDVGVQPWGGGV